MKENCFHKNIIKVVLAILLPVICVAAFALTWYQYLQQVPQKAKSVYLNDPHTESLELLQHGMTTVQEFSITGPLYGVGMIFERIAPETDGELYVRLIKQGAPEQVLLDTVGRIGQVQYYTYTGFLLDVPITEEEIHSYRLEIIPSYTVGVDGLAIGCSAEKVEGIRTLQVNGTEAGGSAALMAVVGLLGKIPMYVYAAVAIWLAVGGMCLVLFCFTAEKRRHLWVLVFLVLVGVAYQIALPVDSAPDEITHFRTAYALSNRWMAGGNTDPLLMRDCDNDAEWNDYYTTAWTYRALVENLQDSTQDTRSVSIASGDVLGCCQLPFAVGAFGITIGRILGWSGAATALFGRFLCLLFYASIVTLAVYVAPKQFAVPLVGTAALPISIHLGGSYSYDSFTIAFGILVIALFLHLCSCGQKVDARILSGFAVSTLLLAPQKAVFLPMCLILLWVLPKGVLPDSGRKWYKGLISLGCILHFSHHNFQNAVASVSPTVVVAAETVGNYSLAFLLQHPGIAFRMAVDTFFTNVNADYVALLGGRLGYLNLSEVHLAELLVFLFGVWLLLGCVRVNGTEPLLPRYRFCLLLSALCSLGLVLVVCIGWTPLSYTIFWGFQSRYLLPVLAAVLVALQSNRVTGKENQLAGYLMCGFVLHTVAICNVFTSVFAK